MKPEDVSEHICKLAKKGLTPSQIGVTLRDSFGVPQVKTITGNKILRILKVSGLAPNLPEDLYYLIKKAVSIRKHLDRNRKDKDSKFRLILVESRIHRLARYYKRVKSLPAKDIPQKNIIIIYIYIIVNTTDITYTTTTQCLLYTILRHNTKVSWLDY